MTGSVTVSSGGILSPGFDIGNLTTSNLTLDAGADFNIGLLSPGPGYYGEESATGTVNVAGAILNLSAFPAFSSHDGDRYFLINNEGTHAVTGRFVAGNGVDAVAQGSILNEGAILSTNFLGSGRVARLTYLAGPNANSVAITLSPLAPTISSGPTNPSGSSVASFLFSDTDVGVTYLTSLDGSPFAAASNPASFASLSLGSHVLEVEAEDQAGNISVPTTYTWTVTPLSVSSIDAVSPSPRNAAVSIIVVTFSGPINTSSLTSGALTLTDNGGPNLITSAVTIGLIGRTTSTYVISGLAGLTAANGNYTLTVDSADLLGQNGAAGTNSLSTSWLMDSTPPTSKVNPLPTQETSLDFPVSVTGSDGGDPPSGVLSYAIYAAINGVAFSLWTTVPASDPTAIYNGQSNTTYAFYSVATDNSGNVENKQPGIEALTYVPDLTPPVTDGRRRARSTLRTRPSRSTSPAATPAERPSPSSRSLSRWIRARTRWLAVRRFRRGRPTVRGIATRPSLTGA